MNKFHPLIGVMLPFSHSSSKSDLLLPFASLIGLASNLGAAHTETMDDEATVIIGLASLATEESGSSTMRS